MASQSGVVYALDPATGCTHWTYKAQAGVRTAISVGPVGPANAPTGYAIYFADAQARAYAVDAATGKELWVRKVDDHRAARATGAPTLHAGRLYVVTSGVSEETAASMPDYECCTFRGSLTSLDATTGEVVWKTYTVDEPQRRGTSTSGKPLWGPAGSPIWSAPTIDEKRGLIYAATGNAYADPAPRTSDAIVAFEIATGRIRWINQIMPDVWILGCGAPLGGGDATTAEDNPNCPEDVGPDFDFSASPDARHARERPRRARRDAEIGRRLLARSRAARPRDLGVPLGPRQPRRRRLGRDRRRQARLFRRGRSADAGAGRLACRRSRDGPASLVHAAAGARLRARVRAAARRNRRR